MASINLPYKEAMAGIKHHTQFLTN